MSDRPNYEAPSPLRRVLFAALAVAALAGAVLLLVIAVFPYVYAESGSARYAREHRAEAMLQVAGAIALLWIAWHAGRRALEARTWLLLGGLLVGAAALKSAASYGRAPDGVTAVGGNFWVVRVPQRGEIDTVYYHLFYKQGARYQGVHDLVSEYRFVPPDCVVFRGLKVVHRPVYAMCGYRTPAGARDTLIDEGELLARARLRPPYRQDWQSIVQQENFR